jgi:hypothetical protein
MPVKTKTAKKVRPGTWEEVEDLYLKILDLFYGRSERKRALAYAPRLHELLSTLSPGNEAILGEECRSLLCELSGDLPGAIAHREREIELIHRLWEISADTPGMSVVLRNYGVEDLADRYDLLAILYHDAGDLDRAILTLTRSKWVCESLKVPFEAEDLLQDYLYEQNADSGLMRSLQKQGWKLSGPGNETPTPPDAAPRRTRRARARRGSRSA